MDKRSRKFEIPSPATLEEAMRHLASAHHRIAKLQDEIAAIKTATKEFASIINYLDSYEDYEDIIDRIDRECHDYISSIGFPHGRMDCSYGDGPEILIKAFKQAREEADRLRAEVSRLSGRG